MQTNRQTYSYKIYPSILDSFQSYLDTQKNYEKFYGFSDNPKYTLEEYEQVQFDELINRINRVPLKAKQPTRVRLLMK